MNMDLFFDVLRITLSILGCAALVSVIVLAVNATRAVKSIGRAVDDNRENIDRTLKELPQIAENINGVTCKAKEEMDSVHNVIDSIGSAFETTAAAVHTFNRDILGNVRNVMHLIKLIKTVFFRKKTGGAR